MSEPDVFLDGHCQTYTNEKCDRVRTREEWSRKREYILSLLGYAVGLGSLWRFPYLCNRNGGGAFLIPYFAGIFTCSVPLFFLEVSIGQFSSRSALHVWSICPLLKGTGITQVVATFTAALPYNLIIAWSVYYLYWSFWSELPWTTCGNRWNTPLCITKLGNNSSVTDAYLTNSTEDHQLLKSAWRKPNVTLTASEEFWQYNTLRVSSGIDNFGTVQVHLVLCILISWVLAFLCMMKGVKSVGKVVYVTALLPYFLLTALLVRSCMMPGAAEGIHYFLHPDFSQLGNVQVWLEALLQGFYSMSTTAGGLITMSSYNSFNNNCFRDLVLLTVVGEASSIFCGLVVFSSLGFMAHQAQIPISEVVSSGSGLGFIIYPEAIAQLPVPQLWAVLFFIMMLTMGIDSMFGMLETVIAGIVETCPKHLQHRRVHVTAGVCLFSFGISISYATEGGVYLFQLLEWYASSFNLLLIACLECVAMNWIYGSERFSDDVEMMMGRRYPWVLKVVSSYFTPVILFASLILSLFLYDPPSYGEYIYPEYAKVIGILMAVAMSLPIPVMLVYQLIKQNGTFLERLRLASSPSTDWGPSRPEDKQRYLQKMHNGPEPLIMQRLDSENNPHEASKSKQHALGCVIAEA
ncbi:sodium- and chloride-dependent glycine transporter 2-like [Haliotis asinina]|uniref:sodium- and chloride-dependent glycine transporter 2-like n=1 Tax=Haliotis asinina TaxID=109174 RepID=UPI0035319B32